MTKRLAHPDDVPANILFPESYEATRREIVRDFAMFGTLIVGFVVFGALIYAQWA